MCKEPTYNATIFCIGIFIRSIEVFKIYDEKNKYEYFFLRYHQEPCMKSVWT